MLSDLRGIIRTAIIGATIVAVILLGVKFFIDFTDSTPKGFFPELVDSSTKLLVDPFKDIVAAKDHKDLEKVNFDVLTTIAMVIIWGTILSELLTSFLYNTLYDIVVNVLDVSFKIIEFFLIFRILFDFFKVTATPNFVKLVDIFTLWTKELWDLSFFNQRIYIIPITLLIAILLIDVIVMDAFFEGVVKRVRIIKKRYFTKQPKPVVINQQVYQTYTQPGQPVYPATYQPTIDWTNPSEKTFK